MPPGRAQRMHMKICRDEALGRKASAQVCSAGRFPRAVNARPTKAISGRMKSPRSRDCQGGLRISTHWTLAFCGAVRKGAIAHITRRSAILP